MNTMNEQIDKTNALLKTMDKRLCNSTNMMAYLILENQEVIMKELAKIYGAFKGLE